MNIDTAPNAMGICTSSDCVESHCNVRGNTLTVNEYFLALTGGILPISFSANDRLKDVGSASGYINLAKIDANGDGDTETIYVIGERAYAYMGN